MKIATEQFMRSFIKQMKDTIEKDLGENATEEEKHKALMEMIGSVEIVKVPTRQ